MEPLSLAGAPTEGTQAIGDAFPPASGVLTASEVVAAVASPTAAERSSEPWALPSANLPAALPPLGWPHVDATAATAPATAVSATTTPSGGSSRLSPPPPPTPPPTAIAAETPLQTKALQRSSPLTPGTPATVDVAAAVAAMTAVSAASVITPPLTLRCPVAGCYRAFSRRSTLTSHARRHEVGMGRGGPKRGRSIGGGGGCSGGSGGGGSIQGTPGDGSSSTGGNPPPGSIKSAGKSGGFDAARVHVCKLCGRRFARRTSVTNHERSHYNERSLVNRRRRREAAAAASSSEDFVALGTAGKGGGWPAAAAAPAAPASSAQGTPPPHPSPAMASSAEVGMEPSSGMPTREAPNPAGPLMLGLSAAWGAPLTATAANAVAAPGGSPSEAYGRAAPLPQPPLPPTTAVSWFDVTPLSRQASNVTGASSAGGMFGSAEGEVGRPATEANAYGLGVATMEARLPSLSAPVTAKVSNTLPWRPTGTSPSPLIPSPLSPTTAFARGDIGAPDYLPSPLDSLWTAPSAAIGAHGEVPDRSSGEVGGVDKVTSATQSVPSPDVALTTGATDLMNDGVATDRGSLVSAATAAVGWLEANHAAAGGTVHAGAGLSTGVAPGTGTDPTGVAAALDGPGWGGVTEPTQVGADNMSMMPHLNSSFPPRDDMIERTLQELFEL
ncbi:hypothetical protein MMPV_003404 [Pyropia vietnamensis]